MEYTGVKPLLQNHSLCASSNPLLLVSFMASLVFKINFLCLAFMNPFSIEGGKRHQITCILVLTTYIPLKVTSNLKNYFFCCNMTWKFIIVVETIVIPWTTFPCLDLFAWKLSSLKYSNKVCNVINFFIIPM